MLCCVMLLNDSANASHKQLVVKPCCTHTSPKETSKQKFDI